MNVRERLESHAAECRAARNAGCARPPLPQDVRDELAAMVSRGERAILVGAILDDAILDGARLDGARLVGASLVGAILDGASLDGAILGGARLDGASLDGVIGYAGKGGPPETSEQRAELMQRRAERRLRIAQEFRAARPDVPVVANLDAAILAAVSQTGCALDMGSWHQCETTHCRAGWAITLAGEAGKALEDRVGPPAAGSLIYLASAGYVPNFYANNDEAMADMREAAGVRP